jgi:hypothetical protein
LLFLASSQILADNRPSNFASAPPHEMPETTMSRRLLAAIGLLFATLAGGAACRADDRDSDSGRAVILPSMMPPKQTNADAQPPAIPFDSATPRIVARAVGGWPHDTGAFTQGLVIDGGYLLESV